jgi:nitroreductase
VVTDMQPTLSITRDDFVAGVAAAVLAPSLHNSQPWRFRLTADGIDVLADASRTPAIADAHGWAVRIAGGAATYNLQLAFAVVGQPLRLRWLPVTDDPGLLARLTPADPRPATPLQHRLFRVVPNRHSNRRPFRPELVPPDVRKKLKDAAQEEGTWLELVVGRIPVAAVAEIAHAANRVLQRDGAYAAELASWSRRDDSAVDGVPADAGGLSTEPQDLLPQRPFSDLVRRPGKDYEEDPLVAVLGTLGDTPIDHLQAGYALQRILLTITDAGLTSSMLSQPIEVPSAQEQLRLALGRYGTPQMVLRIGYGEAGSSTPRRPVTDVID